MNLYLSIFMSFLRIGLFGYGGGPALIPLIEKEAVQNQGWLSPEEFVDTIAMANTLPGPIATKLAICVGLKAGGSWGAVVALTGMLFPSTVLIVILSAIYYKYRNVPSVQGIIRGVRPVVIALLMVTVAHLFPKSVVSLDTFTIAAVSFIVVYFFNVHPILTIIAAGLIGVFFYR